MKLHLDMSKIARGLGAEREGKVFATGGYFGGMQLLADVEARSAYRLAESGRRILAGRNADSSRWRRERSSDWKRLPKGFERTVV